MLAVSEPHLSRFWTPEGHGVRYDEDGAVIGVTIINARWILEHEGYLTITLPHAGRIEAADESSAAGVEELSSGEGTPPARSLVLTCTTPPS
jgi:hypothetical protein